MSIFVIIVDNLNFIYQWKEYQIQRRLIPSASTNRMMNTRTNSEDNPSKAKQKHRVIFSLEA